MFGRVFNTIANPNRNFFLSGFYTFLKNVQTVSTWQFDPYFIFLQVITYKNFGKRNNKITNVWRREAVKFTAQLAQSFVCQVIKIPR